ncbi:MAG: hypothetical protein QM820_58605 [Minicystis sp.]
MCDTASEVCDPAERLAVSSTHARLGDSTRRLSAAASEDIPVADDILARKRPPRAKLSPAELRDKLARHVLCGDKLSPEEVALLDEVFPAIIAVHQGLVRSVFRTDHGPTATTVRMPPHLTASCESPFRKWPSAAARMGPGRRSALGPMRSPSAHARRRLGGERRSARLLCA